MSTTFSENAWLIHSRKYTDSRILLELLCEKSGVLSGVYRVPTKSSVPQMFQLLDVKWKGRLDLKQLVSLEYCPPETEGKSNYLGREQLSGSRLYCGLYLNELLSKLMAREDPHPEIFHAYTRALRELTHLPGPEPALRQFEFTLLDELGYGVDFTSDVDGNAIADSVERCYVFQPESGFVNLVPSKKEGNYFTGATLVKLARGNYETVVERRAAKQLSRQCIDILLCGKVLKSRELFRAE